MWIIASRESRLAMWQAEFVQKTIKSYSKQPVKILGMTTKGDRILDQSLSKIGGKGLFVKELESALFNRFTPLQKCPQNSFIPGTNSDLYNLMGPSPNVANTQFSLLQHVDTHPKFNPDTCGTETELFFNHTRQQLKNVKI